MALAATPTRKEIEDTFNYLGNGYLANFKRIQKALNASDPVAELDAIVKDINPRFQRSALDTGLTSLVDAREAGARAFEKKIQAGIGLDLNMQKNLNLVEINNQLNSLLPLLTGTYGFTTEEAGALLVNYVEPGITLKIPKAGAGGGIHVPYSLGFLGRGGGGPHRVEVIGEDSLFRRNRILKLGAKPDEYRDPSLVYEKQSNAPPPGAELSDLGNQVSPWKMIYTPFEADMMAKDLLFAMTDKSAKQHMLDFLADTGLGDSTFAELLSKENPTLQEKLFFRDFVLWLCGKPVEVEDINRTPWLKKALVNGERWDFDTHGIPGDDVTKFLSSFLDARERFAKQLDVLETGFTGGLMDAYLYFKYIVRGSRLDKEGREPVKDKATIVSNWFGDFRYMRDRDDQFGMPGGDQQKVGEGPDIYEQHDGGTVSNQKGGHGLRDIMMPPMLSEETQGRKYMQDDAATGGASLSGHTPSQKEVDRQLRMQARQQQIHAVEQQNVQIDTLIKQLQSVATALSTYKGKMQQKLTVTERERDAHILELKKMTGERDTYKQLLETMAAKPATVKPGTSTSRRSLAVAPPPHSAPAPTIPATPLKPTTTPAKPVAKSTPAAQPAQPAQPQPQPAQPALPVVTETEAEIQLQLEEEQARQRDLDTIQKQKPVATLPGSPMKGKRTQQQPKGSALPSIAQAAAVTRAEAEALPIILEGQMANVFGNAQKQMTAHEYTQRQSAMMTTIQDFTDNKVLLARKWEEEQSKTNPYVEVDAYMVLTEPGVKIPKEAASKIADAQYTAVAKQALQLASTKWKIHPAGTKLVQAIQLQEAAAKDVHLPPSFKNAIMHAIQIAKAQPLSVYVKNPKFENPTYDVQTFGLDRAYFDAHRGLELLDKYYEYSYNVLAKLKEAEEANAMLMSPGTITKEKTAKVVPERRKKMENLYIPQFERELLSVAIAAKFNVASFE